MAGKAFKIDLKDTATLELITFAAKLSKEMHPDSDYDEKARAAAPVSKIVFAA